MTDLVVFLRARLDEDEADAAVLDSDSYYLDFAPDGFGDALDRQRAKLAAEVAVRRHILDRHHRLTGAGGVYRDGVPCQMCWPLKCELYLWAQPHSGHPDFDPAWRRVRGFSEAAELIEKRAGEL